MKNEMTPIIREIYEQYCDYIKKNKYSPTVVEMSIETRRAFLNELAPMEFACMSPVGDEKFRGMTICVNVEKEGYLVKVR